MLKKDLIKNTIYICLILLVAVISTYYIYHKFQNERDADFSSLSLDVVYHDSMRDKIKITKVVPVTDAIGLSSNAHNISIKNNLTVGVPYVIKLVDDLDEIREDECGESSIGHENIRVSVKVGKGSNKIYDLDELEDGVLLDEEIGALENIDIVIRAWINKDTELTSGLSMHYHGKIQIFEADNLAVMNE